MKTRTRSNTVATFAASVAVGCAAAVAFASAAAVSQAAPSLRHAPGAVIRLDPVVVTVSTAHFAAVRGEDAAVARADDAKKPTRG